MSGIRTANLLFTIMGMLSHIPGLEGSGKLTVKNEHKLEQKNIQTIVHILSVSLTRTVLPEEMWTLFLFSGAQNY